MTKRILLLTAFCMICMSAFASFPVNKKNVEKSMAKIEAVATTNVTVDATTTETVTLSNLTVDAEEALSPAAAAGGDNDMVILLLLWFFLGLFAAHRWYAGKPAGWNILFILTLGGFGIWAIVDLINILTDNF